MTDSPFDFRNAKPERPGEDLRHLVRYGYASGGYICRCSGCKDGFFGQKRASICYDCAVEAHRVHTEEPAVPATTPKKIDEMFAWICTEPDGGEGIPAFNGPMGPMPMIGADKDRIESLRPYALAVAHEMGLPVKLVRFYGQQVIEKIEPAIKAGRG